MKTLAKTLATAARTLCATDCDGKPIKSFINEELKARGKKWSYHLSEGYWSLYMTVCYILVTVTIGWPVVSAIYKNAVPQQYFSECPNSSIFDFTACSTTGAILKGFTFLIYFSDAMIYCFLLAITAVILRWWTGRRLHTRFCARTVLIADSTMNYKLLRAYLSKLKSLTWRFTSFGVCGQNPGDHFVHEYTHLTHSDVLVAAGRPDGRLASLAASESAVMMALMQASFIKDRDHGIEVLTVSHNPFNNYHMTNINVVLPTVRPQSCTEQLMYGHDSNYALNNTSPNAVITKVEHLYRGHSEGDTEVAADLNFNEIEGKMLTREQAIDTMRATLFGQQTTLRVDVSQTDLESLWPEYIDQVSFNQVLACLKSQALKRILDTQRFEENKRKLFQKVFGDHSETVRNHELMVKCFESWKDYTAESSFDRQQEILLAGARKRMMMNLATVPLGATGVNLNPANAVDENYDPENSGTTAENVQLNVRDNARASVSFNPRNSMLASSLVPLPNTVKSGRRQSTRVSMAPGEIANMLTLQGMPGVWRQAEARRRIMFKRLVSGSRAKMRACFDAWKEQSGFKSVDEQLSLMMDECREKGMKAVVESNKSKKSAERRNFVSASNHEYESRDMRVTVKDVKVTIGGSSTEMKNRGNTQDMVLGMKSLKTNMHNAEKLLHEVSFSENFYENRIAAAERLISFFIIFHEMVKPLAQPKGFLPFDWFTLPFDMDRSESRLRVASTPAPVPNHEKLQPPRWTPPKGAGGMGPGRQSIMLTKQFNDINDRQSVAFARASQSMYQNQHDGRDIGGVRYGEEAYDHGGDEDIAFADAGAFARIYQ